MYITKDKEECRRVSAVKQKKMEGESYRAIDSQNYCVIYRNLYDWIKNYKKYDLDGIRNNSLNTDRKPIVSTNKNKKMIKDIGMNKSLVPLNSGSNPIICRIH